MAWPHSQPHIALRLMAGNLGNGGWKDVVSGPLVYAEYLLIDAEVDDRVSRVLSAALDTHAPSLWSQGSFPSTFPHAALGPSKPSSSTVNKQNTSCDQILINQFFTYFHVWQNVQKSWGRRTVPH